MPLHHLLKHHMQIPIQARAGLKCLCTTPLYLASVSVFIIPVDVVRQRTSPLDVHRQRTARRILTDFLLKCLLCFSQKVLILADVFETCHFRPMLVSVYRQQVTQLSRIGVRFQHPPVRVLVKKFRVMPLST